MRGFKRKLKNLICGSDLILLMSTPALSSDLSFIIQTNLCSALSHTHTQSFHLDSALFTQPGKKAAQNKESKALWVSLRERAPHGDSGKKELHLNRKRSMDWTR